MKKYLAIIMTILMCVVLTACANSAPSGEDGDSDEDGYHYAVEDMEIGTNIGSFESEDLDGNKVTDAIFADKDVTLVNVWATFCDPCIGEMPELQALAEELPDNAQVVGIVIDAPSSDRDGNEEYDIWEGEAMNIQVAKDICEQTGVKYTNVLASKSVFDAFSNVEAVPTTFIVDKSGNIICKPFVGADPDAYKKAVEEYLAGL
ncbi:MAG: TlpA disulfide reductase family protein [Oscillospiraceae bacterium]|nr:TlpA disulfide reductase family protein [Oscillospiraceae bacterium]